MVTSAPECKTDWNIYETQVWNPLPLRMSFNHAKPLGFFDLLDSDDNIDQIFVIT